MKSTDNENLYTVVMALAEALQNKDLEIKHLNERIRILRLKRDLVYQLKKHIVVVIVLILS